jgi:SAM-dependent methyltransferase
MMTNKKWYNQPSMPQPPLEDLLRSGIIQNRHAVDIKGLLSRVGVDDGYLKAGDDPSEWLLPEGAEQYLAVSNPRLRELQQLYANARRAAMDFSQWSPQYIAIDVPLLGFRGDCAFVWQKRDLNVPLNFVATYYYFRAMGRTDLIAGLQEDRLFGAYSVFADGQCLTRDRLDSVAEISFLQETLGIGARRRPIRVLDIGSGYGRLAYRLSEAFSDVEVVCSDAVPIAAFICEYYLAFRKAKRAIVVPVPQLDEYLRSNQVDIAVSVHCFSECPISAISWWVDLLRRYEVRHLMIVPDKGSIIGKILVSREADGSHRDVNQVLTTAGYRLAIRVPKFMDSSLQAWGLSPTTYYLFEYSG